MISHLVIVENFTFTEVT